jgi:hypothetical protein
MKILCLKEKRQHSYEETLVRDKRSQMSHVLSLWINNYLSRQRSWRVAQEGFIICVPDLERHVARQARRSCIMDPSLERYLRKGKGEKGKEDRNKERETEKWCKSCLKTKRFLSDKSSINAVVRRYVSWGVNPSSREGESQTGDWMANENLCWHEENLESHVPWIKRQIEKEKRKSHVHQKFIKWLFLHYSFALLFTADMRQIT